MIKILLRSSFIMPIPGKTHFLNCVWRKSMRKSHGNDVPRKWHEGYRFYDWVTVDTMPADARDVFIDYATENIEHLLNDYRITKNKLFKSLFIEYHYLAMDSDVISVYTFGTRTGFKLQLIEQYDLSTFEEYPKYFYITEIIENHMRLSYPEIFDNFSKSGVISFEPPDISKFTKKTSVIKLSTQRFDLMFTIGHQTSEYNHHTQEFKKYVLDEIPKLPRTKEAFYDYAMRLLYFEAMEVEPGKEPAYYAIYSYIDEIDHTEHDDLDQYLYNAFRLKFSDLGGTLQ